MIHFSIITPQFLRADKILSALFEDTYSRSQIQKGFLHGQIKIWQVSQWKYKARGEKYFLQRGDRIEMDIKSIPSTLPPDYRPLEIVFEDENFVIVNKDAGINTHPTPGWNGQTGTLVNQLIAQISDLDREKWEDRPGIVHRLDKDTSGLLIVAKNDQFLRKFQKLIHDHKVKKTYLWLIVGNPKESRGTIRSFIGRDPNNRIKMTIKHPLEPREAITHYTVRETFMYEWKKMTLIEIDIETGRTHQIRVHMASIGHPIVWDATYGSAQECLWAEKYLWLTRQFLHAWKLDFTLEKTKHSYVWPLKKDLEEVLKKLRS